MAKKKTNIFSKIQYFKSPVSLLKYQSTLTPSELSLYICFMGQAMYRHTLKIQISYPELMAFTGIKTRNTLSKAIFGLVEKGWIEDIQWVMNNSNWYTLSLDPKPNKELISQMKKRKNKMSKAKLDSIEAGEKGKFTNGKDLDK